MKRIRVTLIITILASVIFSCNTTGGDADWVPIFNGNDLNNWDMYIGTSLGEDFDSLAVNATLEDVFSITKYNSENVIHISGVVNGSLATQDSYENYHLRLVYKWGDQMYSRRNSGLLYHSFGEFGEAHGTWMPNVECQLMNGNVGDTYLMANTACVISSSQNEDGQYVYNPASGKMEFGEHANGRLIRKIMNAENKVGEWNTIDLYCYGTTAVHVVNGKTVMVNENIGAWDGEKVNPLSSGKIQLQSEGAEMFIRRVDIRDINEIPTDILSVD